MRDPLADVFLPPKILHRISSIEHQCRIQRLVAERPLSAMELQEFGRQRRLIKNREYAQRHRETRKLYVARLEEENERLRERVRHLEEEYRFVLFGSQTPVGKMHQEPPCPLSEESYTDQECDFML